MALFARASRARASHCRRSYRWRSVKQFESFKLRSWVDTDNDRHAMTEGCMISSKKSLHVDGETTLSVAHARSENLRLWLPFIFAAAAYLTLITKMDRLLRDSDIYWHIVVGQWIIDHHAVPHVDLFSFTMRGAPWITSAWLSEVLYFAAFR